MFSKKIKTVRKIDSIAELDNKPEKPKEDVKFKIIRLLEDNAMHLQAAGLCVGILAVGTLGAPDFVLADGFNTIDVKANEFYHKIVKVGKWIIIVKGAMDIIRNVVKGDFDSAKRSGLSNLLVYVILLALPWSFSQVDALFADL